MSSAIDHRKKNYVQVRETVTNNHGQRSSIWKQIGYIQNQKFCKSIKGSKHIYRTTDSIGIDAAVFKQHIVPECTEIHVFDSETKILYTVRTAVFAAMKTYLHHKPHRAQVFLKIKHFKQTKK